VNPDELLLRDIHLPDPVSWWPPAIGWWLVLALALTGIAVAVFWHRHRVALRTAPASLAHAQLIHLQAAWAANQDTAWLAVEISIWLRRVSMSLVSRQDVASLTGSQWQQFLNELAGEQIFSVDDARLITVIPYRAAAAANVRADGRGVENFAKEGTRLLELCQRWLAAATRRRRTR
jgi:hypothetical protein